MEKWDFTNQVVLITGGAGGLGKQLIQVFLIAGAHVYVADRDEVAIGQLNQSYSTEQNLKMEVVDVTKVGQVKAWVEGIIHETNRIDVLINAAGVCPLCPIETLSEPQWDEVVDASLKGTFLVSQAVMSQMIDQRYGRIINISSIGAHTGGAIASAPYAAAKGGIISLSKHFASRLSPHGITVNTVAPGPFETQMIADFPKNMMANIKAATPTRRVGKTEDVAYAILFLADKATSHITGITLDVNGGLYMR